jgi:DNA-binding IclR family transcriptional regulator
MLIRTSRVAFPNPCVLHSDTQSRYVTRSYLGFILAVKRSQTAARVLAVLECVARHQPIGVSELARLLKADKSAVQRAVMTLADEGWIRAASAAPSKWQLTAHILAVAHMGHMRNDLRQRARGALEALRDETGETVLLVVPDIRRFVVIDALESRNMLRTVPHLGLGVPVRQSATSRAVLPYMTREQQIDLLGEAPNARLMSEFATTLKSGYSVSDGDVIAGSTNIAAPILELDGRPVGAVVVSGPSERLTGKHQRKVGAMVLRTARSLSRSVPALTAAAG